MMFPCYNVMVKAIVDKMPAINLTSNVFTALVTSNEIYDRIEYNNCFNTILKQIL